MASLRTIRNGRPLSSDAAAASATAPSSGPASLVGFRLVLPHGVGDRAAERGEQVGARLEAVLVEVVLRAAAGAKDEVAFEVGRVAERAGELVPRHDVASRSCAIGRRRSASGDPSVKECIEPSAA